MIFFSNDRLMSDLMSRMIPLIIEDDALLKYRDDVMIIYMI